MTHTPRPWKDGSRAGSIIAPLQACNDTHKELYGGYIVAEYVSRHDRPLIKAAPYLLGACEAALEAICAGAEPWMLADVEARCRAAIASATGEGKESKHDN